VIGREKEEEVEMKGIEMATEGARGLIHHPLHRQRAHHSSNTPLRTIETEELILHLRGGRHHRPEIATTGAEEIIPRSLTIVGIVGADGRTLIGIIGIEVLPMVDEGEVIDVVMRGIERGRGVGIGVQRGMIVREIGDLTGGKKGTVVRGADIIVIELWSWGLDGCVLIVMS
jgi:hypothetical protein